LPEGAVRCPDPACRAPLTGGDVDAAVDAGAAASFRERALSALVSRSAADGLSCCPSPGCAFVFAWDAANRKLTCPLCQKQHCLVCKSDWHAGVRCEARAAAAGGAGGGDDGMAELAAKGMFKKCPQCSAWASKETGCDAMRCICGQQFCFKCGHKTGGGGNGRGECTCTDALTAQVHAIHANDGAILAANAAVAAAQARVRDRLPGAAAELKAAYAAAQVVARGLGGRR